MCDSNYGPCGSCLGRLSFVGVRLEGCQLILHGLNQCFRWLVVTTIHGRCSRSVGIYFGSVAILLKPPRNVAVIFVLFVTMFFLATVETRNSVGSS